MTSNPLCKLTLFALACVLDVASLEAAPKSMYFDGAKYHVFDIIRMLPDTEPGGTAGYPLWEDARNDATTRSYNGLSGHLATIRSSEENAAASEPVRSRSSRRSR